MMEKAQLLPLFPLELVVFPGEKLNLHIFEPRYQQLIQECLEENKSFGIPAYIDKIMDYGTEMELLKVVRRYPDGRSDISTQGRRAFKVLSFYKTMPDKLYSGGRVEFLENQETAEEKYQGRFLELVRELYMSMNIVHQVEVDEQLSSYDLGHRIGLSKKQEFQLLKMQDENKRLEFLIRHLEKTIPVLKEVERSREIIKQNGHFKHFDPLNF